MINAHGLIFRTDCERADELLEELQLWKDRWQTMSLFPWYFRGQRNADWDLQPRACYGLVNRGTARASMRMARATKCSPAKVSGRRS